MIGSRLFGGIAAVGLALSVVACGSEPEPPVEAPGEVAPEGPPGLEVTGAWMNMPAVAGNPAAVYFTVSNSGEESLTIRGVDVLGTESAMLHETLDGGGMGELAQLPVPAGGELVFAPGGKHVMAMGVGDSLAVGGETEVTLTFANGDKKSFPVSILAPGEQGGGN